MSKTAITETLATNLTYFMEQKKVTQQTLAKKSGIGQTTISLYRNPGSRKTTATGRPPSPTLAKVQALAEGLGVELWELVRPLTPAQRDLIRSVDAVVAERITKAPEPSAAAPTAAKPKRERRKPTRKAA